MNQLLKKQTRMINLVVNRLLVVSLFFFTTLSCTDSLSGDADANEGNGGTIGLTTTVMPPPAATRGTPITMASQLTTMGVFCYSTGFNNWATAGATATPDKMNNLLWTQTGGVWSTASPVNWGSDVSIANRFTFFGYAPQATGTGATGNGLTVSSTTGTPKLTYTVPTDITKQPDLMIATSKDIHPTTGKVPLAYKHALTCIAFKAKGTGQTITAVKVKGVSASGTLSLDASGTPTWSNLSAPGTIVYTAGLNSTTGIVTTGTATSILSADGYLMMIPQTLTTNAQLIVTVDGVDQTFNLSAQDITTWTAGQILTYTIETLPPRIVVDYTNLASSNCYIINPSTQYEMVYRIPIRRVNEIWGDASNTYGINDASYVIGETDGWTASLQWSDKAYMVQTGTTSTVGITFSKSTGVGTKGTADAGGNGWFELTVPKTMTTDKRGSFLVNVKKDGNPYILWSWHFWVTDYNPYATPTVAEYARTTGGDNGEAWVWSVPGGNLFKLRDGTYSIGSNDGRYGIYYPWGGLYATKKIMDRTVGASASGSLGLVYQWGRNIPFVNEMTASTSQTLYGYGTSSSTVYRNANAVALDYAIKSPESYRSASVNSSTNNDWCTTTAVNDPASTKLWHDPKIAYGLGQKSIFDPSPYGFKLIENGALAAFMNITNLIPNTSRSVSMGYEYTRSTVPFTYSLKIFTQNYHGWCGIWTSSPNPVGNGYATAFTQTVISKEDYKWKLAQVLCVEE